MGIKPSVRGYFEAASKPLFTRILDFGNSRHRKTFANSWPANPEEVLHPLGLSEPRDLFCSAWGAVRAQSVYPDVWGKGRFLFGGLTDSTEGGKSRPRPVRLFLAQRESQVRESPEIGSRMPPPPTVSPSFGVIKILILWGIGSLGIAGWWSIRVKEFQDNLKEFVSA
jgi:hypothetical protein